MKRKKQEEVKEGMEKKRRKKQKEDEAGRKIIHLTERKETRLLATVRGTSSLTGLTYKQTDRDTHRMINRMVEDDVLIPSVQP